MDTVAVYNVLFVDDEVLDIQNFFKKFYGSNQDATVLEYENNKFIFNYTSSLKDAFDTLRFSKIQPDPIVLLDLNFPEEAEDGFWLLEKINVMSPDIPVIMLTGLDITEHAFKAGILNADRFLGKAEFFHSPDDIEFLLTEIVHTAYKKKHQPELHDRDHLITAEKYAEEGYDKGEQEYPATIAYYLYENEKILKLIDKTKIRCGENPLKICDIGCGTGRIEELITKKYNLNGENIYISCVDFAGRMLHKLHKKNIFPEGERFFLDRASAENLKIFHNEAFDIVLMGFGVPSYTKYYLSVAEASRICVSGGYCLFSVYNEDSAFYAAQKNNDWGIHERPIAAYANPETGKLYIGDDKEINCETFSVQNFERLLRRNNFEIEEITTFPTLYVSLPFPVVSIMPDSKDSIEEFPFCKLFSKKIYEMDKLFSLSNPNQGHYILILAKKRY